MLIFLEFGRKGLERVVGWRRERQGEVSDLPLAHLLEPTLAEDSCIVVDWRVARMYMYIYVRPHPRVENNKETPHIHRERNDIKKSLLDICSHIT